jgi:hypothetical protein
VNLVRYAFDLLKTATKPLYRPWYTKTTDVQNLSEELERTRHESDAAIEALKLELELFREGD